ncbi:PREDICTED: uncharacterized protein LOC109207333 isoform X2 [Nicotiana attenuata]|uniref:uncharacterized protein LOC109207333 isoform X2 n=1 Tax=Nicotiana attenuata TaxID=49451 RepID=UPI000904D288|nr:PREDICTED: uncharacterized protein LOC109207333 isoform X2 [Nicotiana attenuata]
MSGLACPWLCGAYPYPSGFFKFPSSNTTTCSSVPAFIIYCSNSQFTPQGPGPGSSQTDLKFVLHDALDAFGVNTTHARIAREGFCSQIRKLSDIERGTSICINRGVDLGQAALHIAAEDDSLISHSSVPLPVADFLERLDHLSMEYCSRYSSSFKSSPEHFIRCLETYLYVNKGFRRTGERNQSEPRALYLHSVCPFLYLFIVATNYSLHVKPTFLLNFSSPRGYCKQKMKESDQSHVMTKQSLLVEMLKDLKDAFWPFQLDHTKSPFLRAARAANCSESANDSEESAFELASVKASLHRLQRGVWTSVRFGDMRRALSACEHLILLQTDPKELRDYGGLLYHCGFYKEAFQYLTLYQDRKKESFGLIDNVEEEEALEKLIIRLNLILMEEGWSPPSDNRSFLRNSSEPW